MKDVSEMLNQRIEPTWLTNQKYAMLRPEPHKTLDIKLNESISPDHLSEKSFYRPKQEVFREKYDYYGKVI